jgi:hypothetical protein
MFKFDKSPGPDGWTVEFFIQFFRSGWGRSLRNGGRIEIEGYYYRRPKFNFLALIPKVNKPLTFGDYRPISLCNLCYKVISKIIANMIKPILSRSLSTEQLGFLKGR